MKDWKPDASKEEEEEEEEGAVEALLTGRAKYVKCGACMFCS